MDKRICYYQPNGFLSIVTPVDALFTEGTREREHFRSIHPELESEDDILNFIIKKDVPIDARPYLISSKNIPNDRYFRECWNHIDGNIEIPMDAARKIHMNRLRERREEKFIEMGFPMRLNKQLEDSVIDQTTRDILQALRDMPQTYDLSGAKTPDELKNMIPDILK